MIPAELQCTVPEELIAQQPAAGGRDQSRLLRVDRSSGQLTDTTFAAITHYLTDQDVLVLNNSKVFPARLLGHKQNTGGAVEIVLLHQSTADPVVWEALVGGKRVRPGTTVFCSQQNRQVEVELIKKISPNTWQVRLHCAATELWSLLETIGHTPIPPYIQPSTAEATLRTQYQTVYASRPGSAAAPTAGLHFTPAILDALTAKGVQIEYVTLHVGLGTFAPLRSTDLSQHIMHAEHASIDAAVAQRVNAAILAGKRIVAVGTTSVRTLESFAAAGRLESGERWTDIFITPGYQFQIVDALLTNFHLPKSTLLLLVAAFAGVELTQAAYDHAIAEQYRFYSFGDAMLIE